MSIIKTSNQEHIENTAETYAMLLDELTKWSNRCKDAMGPYGTQDRVPHTAKLELLYSLAGYSRALKLCQRQLQGTVDVLSQEFGRSGVSPHDSKASIAEGKCDAEVDLMAAMGKQYRKAITILKDSLMKPPVDGNIQ